MQLLITTLGKQMNFFLDFFYFEEQGRELNVQEDKMDYVTKEKCLITRDGEGKILPVEIVLESLPEKPMAQMIPLTKGEFQQLITDADLEEELLRTHIVNPSFTEDEFAHIKPSMYGAFKMALLALTTDTSQKEIQDSSTKALLDSIESKKKFTKTKVD